MKWIIFIVACAVLYFTNPSLEKHKSATANEGLNILKETKLDELVTMFGGEKFITNLLKSSTHRSNFVLFSLTKMSIKKNDEAKTVGIGVLGQVYIFPEVKHELINQIDMLKSGAGLFLEN